MTNRFATLFLGLVVAAGCSGEPRRPAKLAPKTGPDRVLVVVNSRSAASDSVGRYYVHQRKIAPSHVVRIDVPIEDEVGEIEYRSRILGPIRSAIDALPVRIDFIVLMTDVPLRIKGGGGYSVDAFIAGNRLLFPPMVGYDSTWLEQHKNPYFSSDVRFNSDQFNMYLVTRIDCGKLVDCLGLIDNAIAATPKFGPILFDASASTMKDPGYLAMNQNLIASGRMFSAAGVHMLVDSNTRFVSTSESLMGYVSWGSNDSHFDSVAYHSLRFLPGALAETFVSTSARTFKPTTGGQSRIVDLIAQGVTGVKGYVSEPYTVALAHPDLLFDRYLRGFTLAESFYAASRLVLWKDIVIGDPLCAPFATEQPVVPQPVVPQPAEPRSIRVDSTGTRPSDSPTGNLH